MGKEERVQKATKRKRGNFLSVYRVMSISDLIEMYNGASGDQDSLTCLVQVISENAACANIQDARKEAADQGILGTLVASRRCGEPWQRVEQTVIKDVTCKNVDGFNEVHKEDD